MILFDLKDNINVFKPSNEEISSNKDKDTTQVKWLFLFVYNNKKSCR